MKQITITLSDKDEEILKRVRQALFGNHGPDDVMDLATVKTCLVRGAERIIEVMNDQRPG